MPAHRLREARAVRPIFSIADERWTRSRPLSGVLEQPAPCRSITDRSTSSSTASAARIASGSASQRRVEPSISVKRNVTVPADRRPYRKCDTTPATFGSALAKAAWQRHRSGAGLITGDKRSRWVCYRAIPARLAELRPALE